MLSGLVNVEELNCSVRSQRAGHGLMLLPGQLLLLSCVACRPALDR